MIERFIANIKTRGLSRSNRYEVIFTPPIKMGDNTNMQDILLYCDQATLPGVSYSTTQNRTFGEFRETPYEKLYDTATFSFYVDKDLVVKYMFDQWMESIQDPMTRKFNYYDNYVVDMKINVQDLMNKTHYTMALYECYPKSINSIQLDYSAKDVMKINVTMQYKYWLSSTRIVLENNEVSQQSNMNMYYDDFYKFQKNKNKATNAIQFDGSSFGAKFNTYTR